MDTPKKRPVIFQFTLPELLSSSFPEKAHDKKFIERRASFAASIYDGAFQSGNDIEKYNEIAN